FLGIPVLMLPSVRPSSDANFYGLTRSTGPFKGEVPLCADLGDQQAATVGQGVLRGVEPRTIIERATSCFSIRGRILCPRTLDYLPLFAINLVALVPFTHWKVR